MKFCRKKKVLKKKGEILAWYPGVLLLNLRLLFFFQEKMFVLFAKPSQCLETIMINGHSKKNDHPPPPPEKKNRIKNIRLCLDYLEEINDLCALLIEMHFFPNIYYAQQPVVEY